MSPVITKHAMLFFSLIYTRSELLLFKYSTGNFIIEMHTLLTLRNAVGASLQSANKRLNLNIGRVSYSHVNNYVAQ